MKCKAMFESDSPSCQKIGSEYTGKLPVKERRLIIRRRFVSKSKGVSDARKAVEYSRIIGVAYLCLNSIRGILLF
ncbi:MAG: hypothetical protein KAX33_07640, partial [Candidatus Lokiarchaeota archaeon]|nr:hypothetical protein [Candidatus Lokiarchaeota archaeon]